MRYPDVVSGFMKKNTPCRVLLAKKMIMTYRWAVTSLDTEFFVLSDWGKQTYYRPVKG